MKKILETVLALLLMLAAVSCAPSPSDGTGSLSVRVVESGLTRTITPESDVRIAEYEIVGSNAAGNTLNKTFRGNTLTVEDMAVGRWNLTVNGKSADGKVWASSGEQAVDITDSRVTAKTFSVRYFTDGTGTFSISVPIYGNADPVTAIKVTLRKIGGETVVRTLSDKIQIDGLQYGFRESFSLAPGAYDLEMEAEGAPERTVYLESLYIYKGETSSFTLPYADGRFMKTAAPVFSVESGSEVLDGTDLRLSCEAGASVCYTTDGSDPFVSGIHYSAPIVLDRSMTVRAAASKEGLLRSEISSSEIKVRANLPVFSVSAGTYDAPFDLSLTTATRGGIIRYTTDGTEPTLENGMTASTVIRIENPMTVRAKVFKDGLVASYEVKNEYKFSRQDGNFEIDGPVYRTLALTFNGMPLPGELTSSLGGTIRAEINDPEPGTDYRWYVNGAELTELRGASEAVIGQDMTAKGDVLLTVKAVWAEGSLTENRALYIK